MIVWILESLTIPEDVVLGVYSTPVKAVKQLPAYTKHWRVVDFDKTGWIQWAADNQTRQWGSITMTPFEVDAPSLPPSGKVWHILGEKND